MDKKTAMENLARDAHEKGVFNGTWLYAENGKIISVTIVNSKPNDPEVLTILKSIKVK